MEHPKQSLIGMGYAPACIQRKNTGGDAFENRLHLAAALIEFRVRRAQVAGGRFQLAAAGFEFFRHAVEGAYQVTNFIRGSDIDTVVEAATGNFLGCLRQRRKGTRDQLGEEKRQPRGYEQDDHREQEQQTDVSLAHAAALTAPLEISLLAGFNLPDSLRELRWKRDGDQNRASAGDRRSSQREVNIVPGELRSEEHTSEL